MRINITVAGIPESISIRMRRWKSRRPIIFDPRPRCSQKKTDGKANARKVGRLKIPATVIVATTKHQLNE
jgi:hypothetical protein